MSSTIPMRLICQEIQLNSLRDLFRESEVRQAAFRGITPEGFAFKSAVKDGDIWVSEYGWEQWRDDRLNDSQLQERHDQKVRLRRQEDSQ